MNAPESLTLSAMALPRVVPARGRRPVTGRSEVEGPTAPDACEYCGRPGCHWSRHPAAVVEVRLDAAGKLPGWEPWRDDPRHDEANP